MGKITFYSEADRNGKKGDDVAVGQDEADVTGFGIAPNAKSMSWEGIPEDMNVFLYDKINFGDGGGFNDAVLPDNRTRPDGWINLTELIRTHDTKGPWAGAVKSLRWKKR